MKTEIVLLFDILLTSNFFRNKTTDLAVSILSEKSICKYKYVY